MINFPTLLQGVTGFPNLNTDALSRVNFADFRRLVGHIIGHFNVTDVSKISEDGVSHNYYYVTMSIYNEHGQLNKFNLLCNAHQPLLAISEPFSEYTFGLPPTFINNEKIEWFVNEFISDFILLTPDFLTQPLNDVHTRYLSTLEMKQIKYWKPETVGEVIFNFYD